MAAGPLAIDAQTMLIVMFMSAVLMAAVLWFACAGRFRDGLARWMTSLWVQALAWLLLAARGMKKHRVREPGHVTVEKYW